MLDRAKAGAFAYPAINVTSSQTLNAALRGFAEAEERRHRPDLHGRRRVPVRPDIKDMVAGAVALAEYAQVAEKYPVHIALHTDHCPKDKLDAYVRPLLDARQERWPAADPLFQSHMWDGSARAAQENLDIARELLAEAARPRSILEVEIGVVGGEEDGVVGAINEKLYSTPEDALRHRRGARHWATTAATSRR